MALDRNEPSVPAYLNILQGVINRLAGNSAGCKTWCITIVSAILVLAINKARPEAMLVGFLPVLFLCLLDAYYLSLECDMRAIYSSFVDDLHKGAASDERIYLIRPATGFLHRVGAIAKSASSLSVALFYGMLAIALFVAWKLVVMATQNQIQP